MIELTKQELEKIKNIQIDILVEIDRICRENNIKYSLAYGTLLGAIRHKGFIPWDDDIDLMMLRDDYDKFLDIVKFNLSDKFYLTNFEDNSYYALPFAKVMAHGTVMKENSSKMSKAPNGVWIDIFPIDISPDNIELKKQQYKKSQRIKSILFCKKNYSFGKKGLKLLFYRLRKIIYLPISHKKLVSDFNKNAKRFINNYKSADEVVCLCGNAGVRKATFKKIWFSNYIEMEFEGHKVLGIADYDSFLTHTYGKYMDLPPEGERVPHHFVEEIYLDGYSSEN